MRKSEENHDKPRFDGEAHLAELFATEANEGPLSTTTTKEPESVVPTPFPVVLSDETREELSERNEARHDWIEQGGAQDRRVTGRCSQRVADLHMSTTDPDATIMLSKDGAHLGYQTHYVVDGGKARMIVDAFVAPAEVMENQPMRGSASSAPAFVGNCGLGRSWVIAHTGPKRTVVPLKPSTCARM